MPKKQKTRSATSTQLGSVKYKDIELSLHHDPITGEYRRQAPTGVDVIGRSSYLTKQYSTTNAGRYSIKEASAIIAKELSELWIHGLNIYPLNEKNIAKKIEKSIEQKDKLLRYSKKQRQSEGWKDLCETFNNEHLAGFDIRTFDPERQRLLSSEYNVKMTKEEEELYEDNCKKKTCGCDREAVIKCSQCPRQMVTSDKVCAQWQKWYNRHLKRTEGIAKQIKAAKSEIENSKLVDIDEALKGIETDVSEHSDDADCVINNSSTSNENLDPISNKTPTFPRLPLRTGRQSLNPELMLVFTHLLATYKVSENDLEGMLVDFANMIFHQDWKKSTDHEFPEQDEDYSSDEELNKTTLQKPSQSTSEPPKKRRRVKKDLTYVFPSRATRRKWLKEGALLNLKYVADKITHKEDNEVVTWRFDDTKKSAGHRLYDVKTNNITINSPDMSRESYTTGFTENISHSGTDQATSIKQTLQILSVLASENDDDKVTVDDIKHNISFWMSDRSKDGSLALDELEVSEDNRLKCCAHTTLCVDDTIDSFLKSVESTIGRDKLIGGEIGLKAIKSNNSIVTVGLIALCKGLSPSHAVLPYSLYMLYKEFCKKNKYDCTGFKGFQSNRFGRTAKMAELFLQHKEQLKHFFEEAVDEKSNLLVQAMSVYINSEWFELACQVYTVFGQEVIQPLCDILGIDTGGNIQREDRNWSGVKLFYDSVLSKLSKMGKEDPSMSIKDKLVARCALKVEEHLKEQLDQVNFLKSGISDVKEAKLLHAPLSNSGCESRFAQLSNAVKSSGGAAELDTISDKQIVGVNKFLLQPGVKESAAEYFDWAHNSQQAKEAKKLQAEFLNLVKLSKSLAINAKKIQKEKKNRDIIKIMSACQEHGGPLTGKTIDTVTQLSEKQLISEVNYLKKALNMDIKLRTRGPRDPVTRKYKYIPQTRDQLIQSIRSAVSPVNQPDNNIQSLLEAALH